MTTSQTPTTPPSRRSLLPWVIGGLAGCAVILTIVVIAGGLLLLRASQAAVVSGVFAPAMATSAPGAARTPRPTAAPIYDPQADARQQIAAALVAAKADGKLVLLDFGADWCPDCVVLSDLLDDATVKPYLDEHYLVVRVDVGEWDNNLDISEEYGDPIASGIPAVVVLGPDGAMLASTGGGELANARSASEGDILGLLRQWAEQGKRLRGTR